MPELEIIGVATEQLRVDGAHRRHREGRALQIHAPGAEYGRGRRHPSVQQDPGDAARRFRVLRVQGHLHVHRPHLRRPPLIPADAKGAALTEQWITCVNTPSIPPACASISSATSSPARRTADRTAAGSTRLPAMEKQLAVLDRRIGQERPARRRQADIGRHQPLSDRLLSAALPREQDDDAGQKHFTGFIERMSARPSVKASKPPPPKKD